MNVSLLISISKSHAATYRDGNVDGEGVAVDADHLQEAVVGATASPPHHAEQRQRQQPPVAEDGRSSKCN